MRIDETLFRGLLLELIDENPLASRAVLSICGIEFTETVDTLAVTLGQPSTLRVNLRFVQEHCDTPEHVKALLIHEFLHVLLRHTIDFTIMTPALNVALDAVINAIIHRRLGSEYSDMMSRFYADAAGPIRLLRPMQREESHRHWELRKVETPTRPEREEIDFYNVWDAVYEGRLVADDVHDLCRRYRSELIEAFLKEGRVLLGNHGEPGSGLDDLEPDLRRRLRSALGALDGKGIWRDPDRLKPTSLRQVPVQSSVAESWRRATRVLLRRLVVPDPRSRAFVEEPADCGLPILNAQDRRGCLRALWNPLLPEIIWRGSVRRPAGAVQIYLDVSGSMNAELQALVGLLVEFARWIRTPFWAFSTVVTPAVIRQGRLETESTGGTSLSAVIEHIARTRPGKALIVTDGFVEKPDPDLLATVRRQRIEALVSAGGTQEILEQFGIPATHLPKLPGKFAGRRTLSFAPAVGRHLSDPLS